MPPEDRRRRRPRDAGPSAKVWAGWSEEDRRAYSREQVLNAPLAEVPGISARVVNALEEENCLLVKDLLALDTAQLLGIQNFGVKTLKEVRAALRLFGAKAPWRLPRKGRKRAKKKAP